MGPILRGTLLTLLVLALVASAGWRVVEVNVIESYSRGWHSDSSAAAARRGVLIRRPVVVAESLTYRGAPLRVTDAWIERVTRVEVPYYLWPRDVPEPAERLVVLTRRDAAPDPDVLCRESLTIDEGAPRQLASAGTWDRGKWYATRRLGADPAFPDTIRLRMERPADSCIGPERP